MTLSQKVLNERYEILAMMITRMLKGAPSKAELLNDKKLLIDLLYQNPKIMHAASETLNMHIDDLKQFLIDYHPDRIAIMTNRSPQVVEGIYDKFTKEINESSKAKLQMNDQYANKHNNNDKVQNSHQQKA